MKRDKTLQLLALLGILLGVASWQLVYKQYQEKIQVIETENTELKQTVDRLEILNARKGEYIEETERMRQEGDAIVSNFPAGIRTEDMIMYLDHMELVDANDVSVSAISMGNEEDVVYPGTTTVDGYELQDDGIEMVSRQSTVTFITTNNGLKSVLNYVYGISTRKSVSNVNVTVTDDGYLQGTMLLDFYYLKGIERPYVETQILGVPTGTTNFFGARNGSQVQSMDEGSQNQSADEENEDDQAEQE